MKQTDRLPICPPGSSPFVRIRQQQRRSSACLYCMGGAGGTHQHTYRGADGESDVVSLARSEGTRRPCLEGINVGTNHIADAHLTRIAVCSNQPTRASQPPTNQPMHIMCRPERRLCICLRSICMGHSSSSDQSEEVKGLRSYHQRSDQCT